jgi:hypothetical protein
MFPNFSNVEGSIFGRSSSYSSSGSLREMHQQLADLELLEPEANCHSKKVGFLPPLRTGLEQMLSYLL